MGIFGTKKKKLTPKQVAQRKYAAGMKKLRAGAKKRKGGKGRVATRSSAAKLRKKLGVKKRK